MPGRFPIRVHIVGSPGTGKSTLAHLLGAKLGIQAQDLDHLPPPPNIVLSAGTERDAALGDYFCRQAADLADGERRVTEGICSGWTAPLLQRAEASSGSICRPPSRPTDPVTPPATLSGGNACRQPLLQVRPLARRE